jgi:hypothetical protein
MTREQTNWEKAMIETLDPFAKTNTARGVHHG